MKKLFVPIVILFIAYLAYPYVTLWRIGQAIKDKDAVTLDALVDWPRVREGFRADITALMSEKTMQSVGDLGIGGALGAAFATKIVEGVIDGYVSSRGLLRLSENFDLAKVRESVRYAFFVSPSQFRVDLKPPGDTTAQLSVLLSMSGLEWKVTSVVLPTDIMLREARKSPENAHNARVTALTGDEVDSLMKQFARCWTPKDSTIVEVRVSLGRDGSLSSDPTILNAIQSASFRTAADIAVAAVRKCQPYRLPPASYDAWKVVEITFDPRTPR